MDLLSLTKKELWQLFPIILNAYNPCWKQEYESEKIRIERAVGSGIIRISHIGSTAVLGLLAKPTIDILLEIDDNYNINKIKTVLKQSGYIYTASPDNPPPHMMFLKGYTPLGFEGQAFHLHVRFLGDWDELYFRDYLAAHKDVAGEYGRLKVMLKEKYEHDRDGYTKSKGNFIKTCTAAARQEFNGRYAVK